MTGDEVQRQFADNPNDIKEAAYKVLQEWFKQQKDLREARKILIEALHKVGLSALVEDLN